MRKILYVTIVCLLVGLLSACHRDAITVTYHLCKVQTEEERYASHFAGFCVYDSIHFSDGSTAVYRQKSGPMNEDMQMHDKNDRLLATYAAPSEQTGQYLIYNYDMMGRLYRIVAFYVNDTEEENIKELMRWCREEDGFFILDMVKLRNAIENLDFSTLPFGFYGVYTLHYDDSGICKKVTSTGGENIVAKNGHRLDVVVKHCPDFWTDDFLGGRYDIEIVQTQIVF